MNPKLAALRAEIGEAAQPLMPLRQHTSARVGGPADLGVVATNRALLVRAFTAALRLGVPCTVLGGGSNILIADEGVEGLVIVNRVEGWRLREHPGGVLVQVESGTELARLARETARAGLVGLEWAANVPGSVGGAVVNNAGAFGGDTASVLRRALLLAGDGVPRWWDGAELAYSYRSSRLKRGECGPALVLAAELALMRGDPAQAWQRLSSYQAERRARQPGGRSLGSMFKNPPGDAAGRLIEAAGCKGWREGGAVVSPKHANFIVNEGEARASDVRRLMARVQKRVWETAGVWLEPEIQFVGRWTPTAALVRGRWG